MNKQIKIYLEPEHAARLTGEAQAAGVSLSALVRQIALAYLGVPAAAPLPRRGVVSCGLGRRLGRRNKSKPGRIVASMVWS